MKFQDYAFTLRKVSVKKMKPTTSTYDDHIDKIFTQKGLKVIDYGFEDEGGLHCHGIVELKDQYIYKHTLFRTRGWKIHLVPLYDQRGWIAYYNKNKDKPEVNVVFNKLYCDVSWTELKAKCKQIHEKLKSLEKKQDEAIQEDEVTECISEDDQWDDDNKIIPNKKMF